MNEEVDHEWELNRENIQPLRKGRAASSLAAARSTNLAAKMTLAEEKMEDVLSLLEGGGGDADSLECVLHFIEWFDRHFFIGRQRMLYEFLWKCMKRLLTMEDYKNEERMLKVWNKLADNSLGNDVYIYEYANSVGSLNKCASLYVAWSDACERRNQIEEARKCLRRGLTAGAMPVQTLHDAHDALEMRTLRREMEGREEVDDEEVREAFTPLVPLQHGVAPVVRTASISGCEEASRGLPTTSSSVKKNGHNPKFQVLSAGEDDESSWLSNLFNMKCDIANLHASNDNTYCLNGRVGKGSARAAPPSFTVWEEGMEEKKVAPAARLILRKQCIREMSIEEWRVSQCSSPSFSSAANLVNRPKQLFLSRADIPTLSFD